MTIDREHLPMMRKNAVVVKSTCLTDRKLELFQAISKLINTSSLLVSFFAEAGVGGGFFGGMPASVSSLPRETELLNLSSSESSRWCFPARPFSFRYSAEESKAREEKSRVRERSSRAKRRENSSRLTSPDPFQGVLNNVLTGCYSIVTVHFVVVTLFAFWLDQEWMKE